MMDFTFSFPTEIHFGVGVYAQLGEIVRRYGAHALLVEQPGPLEELGVFERGVASMVDAGVSVTELTGISSNPRLSKVEEGIDLALSDGVDVVVAVGGGSTIDTAKAIAFGAADEDHGDVWDFFAGARKLSSTLPVVAVSTISATGAETSCHCVITNDREDNRAHWQKWAVHDNVACPKAALVDPELLATVPPRLTAAGMADTISHVIEGYFDEVPGNSMADAIGEGVVKTILGCEGVLDDPDNLELRGDIAWASTLAMCGIQDCGRSNLGWPAHWIQHAVGALTDSSHGEGLAVINPAWLDLANQKNPEKFVTFTERVFGFIRDSDTSDREYGQLGIDALRAHFKAWGLPTTLRELGVTRDMFPVLVENVMNNNEAFEFTVDEIESVLNRCY